MPPTALTAAPPLLAPGDAGYEALRPAGRRPALIAACANADDVAAAVRIGRERRLGLAVRGGGLGPAGPPGDGGLAIDLRGLRGVEVDPAARTVRAGGGATWARLDAATLAHGLAVTGARVPCAGVAGVTLGCGSGWLERLMGLTSDNLLAAELVTAEGRVVTASRSEHPDLFWALHGGGSNFGVVTALELALHPMAPATRGGVLRIPPARAASALRGYAELMAEAPDVLCGGALLDRRGLAIVALWAGDPAAAGPWLAALEALAPGGAGLATVRYLALQRLLSGPPERARHRAGFLRALDEGAATRAAACARRAPSAGAVLLLQPLGGAFARFRHDTALGHRDAGWAFQALASATDVAWLDGAADALATEPGTWPGFAPARPALAGEAYAEATFRRLARLKARWDPENVFRHNHNVHPARTVDLGAPE